MNPRIMTTSAAPRLASAEAYADHLGQQADEEGRTEHEADLRHEDGHHATAVSVLDVGVDQHGAERLPPGRAHACRRHEERAEPEVVGARERDERGADQDRREQHQDASALLGQRGDHERPGQCPPAADSDDEAERLSAAAVHLAHVAGQHDHERHAEHRREEVHRQQLEDVAVVDDVARALAEVGEPGARGGHDATLHGCASHPRTGRRSGPVRRFGRRRHATVRQQRGESPRPQRRHARDRDERGDGEAVGARHDEVDRRRPDQRDEEASRGRGEQAHEVHARGVERDRIHHALAPDDLGHHRLRGRQHDGLHHALHDRRHEEVS